MKKRKGGKTQDNAHKDLIRSSGEKLETRCRTQETLPRGASLDKGTAASEGKA